MQSVKVRAFLSITVTSLLVTAGVIAIDKVITENDPTVGKVETFSALSFEEIGNLGDGTDGKYGTRQDILEGKHINWGPDATSKTTFGKLLGFEAFTDEVTTDGIGRTEEYTGETVENIETVESTESKESKDLPASHVTVADSEGNSVSQSNTKKTKEELLQEIEEKTVDTGKSLETVGLTDEEIAERDKAKAEAAKNEEKAKAVKSVEKSVENEIPVGTPVENYGTSVSVDTDGSWVKIPDNITSEWANALAADLGGHVTYLGDGTQGKFKSYMDKDAITMVSSPQYKLKEQAYLDDNGLACVDGRNLVDIGENIDIVLSSGKIFHAKVGDMKARRDTDANEIVCVWDNSIVEFLVDTPYLNKDAKRMGDVSYAGYEGGIVAVIKID